MLLRMTVIKTSDKRWHTRMWGKRKRIHRLWEGKLVQLLCKSVGSFLRKN